MRGVKVVHVWRFGCVSTLTDVRILFNVFVCLVQRTSVRTSGRTRRRKSVRTLMRMAMRIDVRTDVRVNTSLHDYLQRLTEVEPHLRVG